MKITAKVAQYNPAVGACVTIHDATDRIVAFFPIASSSIGSPEMVRNEVTKLANHIAAAINAGQPERRIHHPGRGSDYDVVASEALFQVSVAGELMAGKTRIVCDGDPVTVYRNEHGTFVRFVDEMVSPRFEEIQS